MKDDPRESPRTDTRRLLDNVQALQYVTVQNTPTYRAIVQVFFEAKQRYVIEMRPDEVLARIQRAGLFVELEDDEALDRHLDSLVQWGNLTRSHDTSTVSRIEDFYRKRYVYGISAVGEAAHRAVMDVEATVGRSGSLQANMLGKIRDALRGIVREGSRTSRDTETLVKLLHDLHAAFDTLTQEATRFIGDLNRHVGGGRMDEERFILYKQAVLAYVSRFIEKLRRLSAEISAEIGAVEGIGSAGLIEEASGSADLPPALSGDDPRRRWIEDQQGKWEGIRTWFLGESATVERLAAQAVNAVVGLTRTLGRINDARTRPVDRTADFRTLARWFSQCADDDEAHSLWQRAFGLYASRHFHMADADVDMTGPSVSWWDAEPVQVPVRMRTRGNISRAGRPSPVPDFSRDKEWIAARRRQENERLQAALRRFVGRGPIRMAEVASLDPDQFHVLLGLLDEVLSAPADDEGTRRTRTLDARLELTLLPPQTRRWVVVETPAGNLRLLDYTLEVSHARDQRVNERSEDERASMGVIR